MASLRKKPLLLLALMTASCWFGFRSQREIWFTVIASALVLSYRFRSAEGERRSIPSKHAAAALFIAVLFALARLAGGGTSESDLEKAVTKNYPVAASAYIQSHALPGPLYNGYNWGGYLIWRLPKLPVSMDGRSTVHGDERVMRSLNTMSARHDWAEDKELMHAGTILLERDCALASVLRSDYRFRLVYEDSVASLFQPTH
jgi:hypothetical protein